MDSIKRPPEPRTQPDPPQPSSDADEAEKNDERLDEELDETFPASDPIPYRHDS
ncbi:MAG TPA: hypothetical protein VGP20_03505 [Steroidobacteraceae bacterium]|jgi:hypothetical protein|nr:hypothetical protein [Steroidobacteraceae bacterium]